MLNWDSLSDAEEAEIEDCTATITVPSFAETVSQNEEFIKSQEAFQEAFPVGKRFVDKDTAKTNIQELSRSKNIPFEAQRSSSIYIKLICKHFVSYRSTRQKDNMDKDGQTVERGDTLGDIADGNEGVEGDCNKRPS